MCGIAGIVSKHRIDADDLARMSSKLRHRGPDDEGFTLFSSGEKIQDLRGDDTIPDFASLSHIQTSSTEDARVGLAHRRLSIIDLSAAGHQPMHLQNRYSIVFNGEVYNYREIKKDLEALGHHFQTGTDTEVILAAYHQYGKDCIEKFIGMWAFALYDRQEKSLFLSRDRFGIKPVYFFSDDETFAFASEIKALLALKQVTPEVKIDSAFEYISFGATASPEDALFSLVNVLAPGHNLFLKTETLEYKLVKYYDLKHKVSSYSLPADHLKLSTFTELLNHSIDLHLRSDVTVGSALSGGLDSSSVVALSAPKMQGKIFKTFTAAYHEEGIDESHFADLVTDRLPNTQTHFVYPQIQDYWNDFEKLTWHQDLPISSTSMFAQWEVMKCAQRENTKVLLDGQGADEILGGYYNFAGIYLLELIQHLKIGKFLKAKKELEANFNPNMRTAMGRAAFYFLPGFAQRKIRSKKRLGMSFIASQYRSRMTKIQVPERGGKSYRDQSFQSIRFGLQDLLRYEDRNSMAFSIESRVPFLDHRIVEFCIALDNDWKIKNGWTKYILRKVADPVLNPEVTWRKDKMGFVTPQQKWKEKSASQLASFVDKCPIPDFIDRNYLANLCSEPISNATHLSEFWRIISFLKWAEVFKVRFV
jgi:asparagine synthase (glutamine-hydrolysing)